MSMSNEEQNFLRDSNELDNEYMQKDALHRNNIHSSDV